MNAKQWQYEFIQSLFQGLSSELSQTFADESTKNVERFSVYQNNIFYSLSKALAELYPSIKVLVGEEFFQTTAQVYIRENPPKTAAMVYFSWDFPNFLEDFEHTQTLPYLSDIARLDLARHRAYHAEDLPVLGPVDFAHLKQSTLDKAKLKLNSSTSIINSLYPIFSIWQMCQQPENNDADININLEQPESVIVLRNNFEVLVFSIDDTTSDFYQLLSDGQTICQSAANKNLETITTALALGIENGFFESIEHSND